MIYSNIFKLQVKIYLVFIFLFTTYANAFVPNSLLTWTNLAPPTSPSNRNNAAMAFDPSTGQMILFGGSLNDGNSYLGDTWSWDGTTWTQLSPANSPSPRRNPTMAFDPSSGQLILFGGLSAAGYRNDTWTWNGTNWVQLSPASSPSVRQDSALAFDETTGQLILFGGYVAPGVGYLNDTWTWTGTNWVQLSPTTFPSYLANPTMAFDQTSQQLILFGQSVSGTSAGATWVWNGTTWTQLASGSTPPAGVDAVMAFDPSLGKIVWFGSVSETQDGRTYVWNGTSWTSILPTTSPPISGASNMAYDRSTGQLIIFGGFENNLNNTTNGTWKFGLPCTTVPQAWTNLNPLTTPSNISNTSMAFDYATNQLILLGTSATVNRTYNWDGINWIQLSPANNPTAPRVFSMMAFDGTTRKLILFSGYNFTNGSYYSDTWSWDGTNWTNVNPATSPPGRRFAGMAFNQESRQLILFGGEGSGGSYLGDTWSWDGVNWTQLSPANSPSARQYPSMAYDEGSGRIILFGGYSSGGTNLSDTWAWDGTNWTQLSPATSPSGRISASMAYNPLIGRLVLFGGSILGNPNPYSDTWTWNGTNWTQISPLTTPSPRQGALMRFDEATGQLILFGGSGTSGANLTDTWNLGFPVPTVTNVTPNQGSTLGGNTVTLTGTNFYCAATAIFGPNNATNVVIDSPAQITLTTPAGTGTVNAVVSAPGGVSASSSNNLFTYIPPPTVTSISPTQGPITGNTTVTLNGTNFIGVTAVIFGTTATTDYTVNSSNQITVVSPVGSAGNVNIRVTAAGGTSTTSPSNLFTYVAPPTVTGISPNQGPTVGGTTVTLTGTNFTGATAVTFGTIAETSFVINSSNQITAISLPGNAGNVNVTVTTAGGTSAISPDNLFTYVAPPTITSISPTQGPTSGGTTVILTGTDFTGATSVTFGGIAATSYTIDSNNQITAISPAGSAGSVNIRVTTGGGTSTISPANLFTYVAPPTVTSISPTQGPTTGGTTVILTGTNLAGTTAVTFGTTAAISYTVNSNNQITATSPAGSAGNVNITVTTVGGTSATSPSNLFTYVAPPTVTSISPNQGPITGGTTVILTGTNFTAATAVTFGTTAAISYTVNSNNQITATSPAGIAGSVNITVTTVGGTSATSPSNLFTYVAPPTITSIVPNQGPVAGGTTVTLNGTNFTGATAVTFGTTAATSYTINSSNQITATSPAGIAGSVNITVTTVGGTSAASPGNLFTYVAQPTVTSISPTQGPTTGNTTVILTGTDFIGATAVTFGGVAAISFTIDSNNQITAVSPAGIAGSVNITVTTVGGTSAASPGNLFTYVAPPTVTSISPTQGPTTGNTTVTLTGTDFTGATAVNFGGIAAANFTIDSNNQITATSPAGSAGNVTITVTTAGGTSSASPANLFTYIAPPAVTFISPAQGPLSGGTTVILTGSNFNTTTAVLFGSLNAISFNVDSDNQITAISPAGAPGNVNITVTSVGGTSSTGPGNVFSYIAPPTITNIFPNEGPEDGGTVVTLTGTDLGTTSAIFFGSTPATSFSINSDNQVIAISPAGISSVNVTVVTAGGTSAANPANLFTYIPNPIITTVNPSEGPLNGGTAVTITGRNFNTVSAVFFGNSPATSYSIISDNQIIAISPPEEQGSVNIRLVNLDGPSSPSSNSLFRYVGSPSITSISPTQGLTTGGTLVTIMGSDLATTQSVLFGSVPALSFTIISDNQINAISPAQSEGTYSIIITTDYGTSSPTTSGSFTYLLSILPPKNVKGEQINTRFPMQTDRVNIITWQPPSNGVTPVSYKIYRDAELTDLIATIDANRSSLRFEDHNRRKNRAYNYFIVSVGSNNSQSTAAKVRIGKTK